MRAFVLLLLCWLIPAAASASQDEIDTTLQRLAPAMEARLSERFTVAGVSYPPARIQLIVFKESQRLELWAFNGERWRFVHDYPVFAASGEAGPKLREGDRQVPEGFYRIVELNPNSHYHLSMKLNYPNSFDWAQAAREGREQPGSNIFIHGSAWSAGCLAVGNHYVEELFYLVGKLGMDKVGVLIAPYDFRRRAVAPAQDAPDWVARLYAYMNLRLAAFPLSEKTATCAYGCRAARATLSEDN